MRTSLALLITLSIMIVMDACPLPGIHARAAEAQERAFTVQQLPIATKELYLQDARHLQDARRQKTLPLRISYPKGAGPFPIIIFSHGLFGSRDGYTYLARYWAEHGYVCIQPSHQDSLSWQREQGEQLRFRAMLRTVSIDKSHWIERAGDISFILDSLPLIPQLAGKLDTTRIGVGGHSYGAFTSLIIAGAQLPHKELAPKVATLRDPRVKAIIALSPQELRVKENSLAFDDKNSFTVLVPAMFMTGDRDATGFSKADARSDAFDYSPPGNKYFVSIFGANHLTFSGRAADEPSSQTKVGAATFDRFFAGRMAPAYGDDDEHRRLIEQATTLFWDAYVKGDRSALSFLQRGGLATKLGNTAIVRSR
jgi:predicted dienelactone hydrolase